MDFFDTTVNIAPEELERIREEAEAANKAYNIKVHERLREPEFKVIVETSGIDDIEDETERVIRYMDLVADYLRKNPIETIANPPLRRALNSSSMLAPKQQQQQDDADINDLISLADQR